jgi:tetratricopeptide (TPR) repeat protein
VYQEVVVMRNRRELGSDRESPHAIDLALIRDVAINLLILVISLAPFVNAEPVAAQETRNASAPTIGAATGKVLNAAIEALNAEHYDEALAAIATLNRDELRPYERSKVEQILFNIAYAQERYAEARQHLQRAIDAGGLNAQEIAQARYQGAQLFMTEEQWQEGAAALEEWFETAVSPNSAAYYLLAVAYYQMGDLTRALPPAQQAVELMDQPQESWIGLLLALRLQREEYQEAIRLLQRLVVLVPDKKAYWLQLSSVYGQTEDYVGALAIMQLAYNAGLVTEDAEVRRLADLLLFNDLPYRGAQVLGEAIDAGTVTLDDKLYEKLAHCWIAAGEFEQAVAPLTRAAELSSTGDSFVRLGQVHVQREDWSAAENALDHAIGKGRLSDAAGAQWLMGVSLFHQQRLEDARAWFQQAEQSEQYRQASRAYLALIESELAERR